MARSCRATSRTRGKFFVVGVRDPEHADAELKMLNLPVFALDAALLNMDLKTLLSMAIDVFASLGSITGSPADANSVDFSNSGALDFLGVRFSTRLFFSNSRQGPPLQGQTCLPCLPGTECDEATCDLGIFFYLHGEVTVATLDFNLEVAIRAACENVRACTVNPVLALDAGLSIAGNTTIGTLGLVEMNGLVSKTFFRVEGSFDIASLGFSANANLRLEGNPTNPLTLQGSLDAELCVASLLGVHLYGSLVNTLTERKMELAAVGAFNMGFAAGEVNIRAAYSASIDTTSASADFTGAISAYGNLVVCFFGSVEFAGYIFVDALTQERHIAFSAAVQLQIPLTPYYLRGGVSFNSQASNFPGFQVSVTLPMIGPISFEANYLAPSEIESLHTRSLGDGGNSSSVPLVRDALGGDSVVRHTLHRVDREHRVATRAGSCVNRINTEPTRARSRSPLPRAYPCWAASRAPYSSIPAES